MVGEGRSSFFGKKEAKKLYPLESSEGAGRCRGIVASRFSLAGSRWREGGGLKPTLRAGGGEGDDGAVQVMAGEGRSSFFGKKEAKKLYPWESSGGEGRSLEIIASRLSVGGCGGGRGEGGGLKLTLRGALVGSRGGLDRRASLAMTGESAPKWIKVFCFFFSKKKCLPCLGLA